MRPRHRGPGPWCSQGTPRSNQPPVASPAGPELISSTAHGSPSAPEGAWRDAPWAHVPRGCCTGQSSLWICKRAGAGRLLSSKPGGPRGSPQADVLDLRLEPPCPHEYHQPTRTLGLIGSTGGGRPGPSHPGRQGHSGHRGQRAGVPHAQGGVGLQNRMVFTPRERRTGCLSTSRPPAAPRLSPHGSRCARPSDRVGSPPWDMCLGTPHGARPGSRLGHSPRKPLPAAGSGRPCSRQARGAHPLLAALGAFRHWLIRSTSLQGESLASARAQGEGTGTPLRRLPSALTVEGATRVDPVHREATSSAGSPA